jgi:hypothetical protein
MYINTKYHVCIKFDKSHTIEHYSTLAPHYAIYIAYLPVFHGKIQLIRENVGVFMRPK